MASTDAQTAARTTIEPTPAAAPTTPTAAAAPTEPAARKATKGKRALPTASLPALRLPRRSREKEKAPAGESPESSLLSKLPLPNLTGRTAAIVVGAVIGFALVLSTAGVLRGCEALRGTKSCGGAGGFTLLLVLIVAAIYVGGMLLRAFGIPDPGSTSFLAVGIVVVLAMVVFINSLLDWWMFLLIPTMSAGAYALSHYVTTALVEPAMEQTRDQRVD